MPCSLSSSLLPAKSFLCNDSSNLTSAFPTGDVWLFRCCMCVLQVLLHALCILMKSNETELIHDRCRYMSRNCQGCNKEAIVGGCKYAHSSCLMGCYKELSLTESCLGCNMGHTAGDFVSCCTCHLSHCTHHRCRLCRYRLKPQFF